MATVSVRNVWKTFGDQVVLENLKLEVADHEIVTNVGASGRGNKTFIKMRFDTTYMKLATDGKL